MFTIRLEFWLEPLLGKTCESHRIYSENNQTEAEISCRAWYSIDKLAIPLVVRVGWPTFMLRRWEYFWTTTCRQQQYGNMIHRIELSDDMRLINIPMIWNLPSTSFTYDFLPVNSRVSMVFALWIGWCFYKHPVCCVNRRNNTQDQCMWKGIELVRTEMSSGIKPRCEKAAQFSGAHKYFQINHS